MAAALRRLEGRVGAADMAAMNAAVEPDRRSEPRTAARVLRARLGIAAEAIHGDLPQPARERALRRFAEGKLPILVATDVAARGIDVEALSHVVNFDVPAVPEDYSHRVGRTGRAELTGDAFTFVAPSEEGDLRAIERAIKRTLPRVTLPDFDYRARPQTRLEIPLAERIAAIRARKKSILDRAMEEYRRGHGSGRERRQRRRHRQRHGHRREWHTDRQRRRR